jgi:putative component of membrane protein insertase Oxa1/YidC/SpoIIIJ protein YidD
LRCQPFGTSGIDRVPLEVPQGAAWYLPWRYGRWR